MTPDHTEQAEASLVEISRAAEHLIEIINARRTHCMDTAINEIDRHYRAFLEAHYRAFQAVRGCVSGPERPAPLDGPERPGDSHAAVCGERGTIGDQRSDPEQVCYRDKAGNRPYASGLRLIANRRHARCIGDSNLCGN